MKQRILSPANEVQLVGFKNPHNGIISLLNNTSGISAAINIDSLGMMCYEAIIPFSTFYKNELTPADVNKAFTYEIRINGLPAPESHEKGSGDQGMDEGVNRNGGSMGGGHHEGGQHGGMAGGGEHGGGGGNNTASSDLYVASHITQKLKFSVK